MTIFAAALAVVVGISMGLLGAGGSVLTVPIFVYVLGVGAKPAIAMSLGVVGATALVAALSHLRGRFVSFRVAAIFGPAAMVGAYFGATLATYLSGRTQLIGFAVVLLTSAALMLRNARTEPPESATLGVPHLDARAAILLVLQGFGVGVLTAIIGVGGGFIIVPALVLIAGLPMRVAVGTSLVIIGMNALSGFAGYLGRTEIDWELVGTFTALAAAGTVAGSFWSRRVPQARLKQMFAYVLVAVALYVLYRTVFVDPATASA
ncbi:MAG: sulfite exporter TauE/SafE family protein [Gemmatimonadaceae bacterium]